MLEDPTLPMVLALRSFPLKLLTLSGWKSISANMIGGSNNAGESSLSVFAVGPIFADKPDNKDSIAYFCLGERFSIYADALLYLMIMSQVARSSTKAARRSKMER